MPKEEYERVTKGWVGKLHRDLRTNVTPETPVALNHQLCFRVGGGRQTVFAVVASWRDLLSTKMVAVRGRTDLRVSAEVSPTRRAQCKKLFDALACIKSKGKEETDFHICPKSLKLYSRAYAVVGSIDPASGQWSWEEGGLRELGLEKKDMDDAMLL